MTATTRTRARTRRLRQGAAVLGLTAMAFATSGCYFFPAARQLRNASGGADVPWWCDGSPALSNSDCDSFSLQLDQIIDWASAYPHASDAIAAGGTLLGTSSGHGTAYAMPGRPATFTPNKPQVLIYAGDTGSARLAGVGHRLLLGSGAPAPAGYPGGRDTWIQGDADQGEWILPMWVIRGFENQPDVFADSQPCLVDSVTYTATTDACYVASHPEPLDIVVTNDDGIGADGIDAVVEALRTLDGVTIQVVAPATNQSGTGDRVSTGTVTASSGTTKSGYVGTKVNGTPADSVIYALKTMKLTPGLVVSGVNYGANMGTVIPLSGTVGAARTAARRGVPAVAASQGIGTPTDFASGAAATLAWVEEFRLGLVGPPGTEVANINIPTCSAGSIRGTVNTVVATGLNGRGYNTQDCTSSVTTINDDIDAMNVGYISRADAKLDD